MRIEVFLLCMISLRYVEGQGFKYGCPKTMAYCTCAITTVPTSGENQIVVTCNNFNGNEAVFGKDFENMANIEIDELVINNYNPMRLPENVFMDSNRSPVSLIRKISIRNSPNLMYLGFTSTSNYTFFDGLGQSLETIYIENCKAIRQDQWIRFSKSLTSDSVLRTVNFYGNSYPIENFDAFNDLPNIEKIYMRNNDLYEISADLSKFLNLKVLDLSNNKLNDFELKGNSLHLTSIYLRANNIQIIKESLLKVVQNLMRIDFTGNPLSCYCSDVGFITNNNVTKQLFKGNCYQPTSLQNKPLAEVTCAP